MKTVTIMQPTFLPWLGWFDLLDQSDVMVLLDDVGFSKQSWQQRNQIRVASGLQYLSLPVKTSGRLGQLIRDTSLDNSRYVDKIIRTVQGNYAKAPFFSQYFDSFCDSIKEASVSGKLLDLNYGLILWLTSELGINKSFILASDINVGGTRGSHVAALCKQMNATHYLSPAGAEAYLMEDYTSFETAGIEVRLQCFEHPKYRQCFEPFEAYASVLDLLMNEGKESINIIRSGRRESRLLGDERVSKDL